MPLDTELGRCRAMVEWWLWNIGQAMRDMLKARSKRDRAFHAGEIRRYASYLSALQEYERDLLGRSSPQAAETTAARVN